MRTIQLTQGKEALVDDEVYEMLFPYSWHNDGHGYGATSYSTDTYTRSTKKMHRFVWELVNGPIPEGMQVDHINGLRHDNRLVNLRVVNRRQNNQNRREHREGCLLGTYLKKDRVRPKPWAAHIQIDKKTMHLGYFATEQEAHEAYLKALVDYGV